LKFDAHVKFPAFLLILFLLIVSAPLSHAQIAASADSKTFLPQILILNSYHQGYTWSDNEITGIIETLHKSGIETEIQIEHLDSKHFPQNALSEQLLKLYAFKYAAKKPDIVIALDNPAFGFAVKCLFAGLNDYAPEMLLGEKGVTGVVEKQDFVGTVKLALLLQPDLKEIVMLHDFTSSGLASRKEAEEQFTSLASSVKLSYLPEMTIDEIVATVKKLKPGTVVLPFSFSRDKAGKVLTHSELAKILSESSPVPVYGTKEERLGYGIIGGSLLGGINHGAQAAELVVRILRGENPDSIPVIKEPRSRFSFDYQQLKKFRISPDKLPPDSEIINRPESFYQQHATVINVSFTIILVLAASLAIVIIANRRKIAAEEALIESERGKARVLEAANREMESFLYTISHDLQAPLRHITSYSEILLDEYREKLDEQGVRYLSRLKQASTKMCGLINDILSLSRIAKAEIYRTPCDVGKLAKDVFDELQAVESSRAVVLTVSTAMKANADRSLLTLALDHLVGNAWKYTAKNPQGEIYVGSKNDAGRVIFYIKDNGVGFDMQYAEKLFAPFQRLHADSEFEGTGVGLATVQRIINRHGGQIWAESAPGEGTTFFFTLEP